MSSPTLYRSAGLAGVLAAVLLAFNVWRRAGVLPTNGLTHAIAPFAPLLALFAVTGLMVWQREQLGRLGFGGYMLSMVGLGGALGTEFTTHFVFANLDRPVVDALVQGPMRPALAAVATTFTLGAVGFGLAMLRVSEVPRAATIGYLVALAPFGWRNTLPEIFSTLDGTLASIAIGWISLVLLRAFRPQAPLTQTRSHPADLSPGRP